MSPSTVQQTLLGVKTKTFIDWDDFTPVLAPIPEHEARGTQSPCEAKAMKIPKCTLDAKWLADLAREIATTTPKILAHLEAKAKAQAKAKATQIPKCTLDAKWLKDLAREIATTTPKNLGLPRCQGQGPSQGQGHKNPKMHTRCKMA